jgi:hypothetical protein
LEFPNAVSTTALSAAGDGRTPGERVGCARANTPAATALTSPDQACIIVCRRHTMKSTAKSADEYLAELPADRRAAIGAVRKVILDNLPKGYEECMQYGMIGYVVPHSIYPAGYHCDPKQPLQYVCLGSQKNHMALHAMCAYGDQATLEWLQKSFKAAGKQLDMGKACLRFKKLDDLPLEVIGQLIARVPVKAYVARVEQMLQRTPRKRSK